MELYTQIDSTLFESEVRQAMQECITNYEFPHMICSMYKLYMMIKKL